MRKSALVICVLLAALPVSWAWSSTVLALTVEELTERSDRVIRATVVSIRYQSDESSGLSYRLTVLQVIEDLVGDGPSRVVLRQLGGEVGGRSYMLMGDAGFEEGEEVVVFVRDGSADGRMVHLEGLSLGKFRVDRPEGIEALAVRDLGGLGLVRMGGGPVELEAVLTLDELRLLVRRGIEPTSVIEGGER